MAEVRNTGGKNESDEVGWINSPESTKEISLPLGLGVRQSVGVVDAKPADQKKQQDCVTEERCGHRQPSHGLGKRGVLVWVASYPHPPDPEVDPHMVEQDA